MLKRLISEPMVQFFLIAALLYVGYRFLHHEPIDVSNRNVIVIDDAVLRRMFLVANPELPQNADPDAMLASLSPVEKQRLAEKYVKDEALFRTAVDMGLDRDDIVIRRRLIQKLDFLIEDLNGARLQPGDGQLQAYLDRHKSEFRTDETLSFGQILLASEDKGESVQVRAARLLDQLNRAHAGVDDAVQFPERFPLRRIYHDMTKRQVAREFGNEFSARVFDMASRDRWLGPVKSGYGYHLVYIVRHKQGRVPPLSAVREEVVEAFRYHQRNRLTELAEERIAGDYRIVKKFN